tara:strand:+ start:146 stop:463 length:318 start_codon:yes stop_codon:yes gene_type:complete
MSDLSKLTDEQIDKLLCDKEDEEALLLEKVTTSFAEMLDWIGITFREGQNCLEDSERPYNFEEGVDILENVAEEIGCLRGILETNDTNICRLKELGNEMNELEQL